MQRALLIAAVLLGFSVVPALSQARFGTPMLEGGGSPVNPGDVYGLATFELRPANGLSIEQALSGVVRGIVQGRYGKTEGTYLFTIELSQNGSVVAVQPLVTVTVSNDAFLFWTTASSVTKDINYSGTLLATPVITDRNNRVTISLKSYYKRATTFDTSAFDLLNKLISDFSLVGTLDSVGLSSGVLDSAKSILTKLLSGSDDSTEHVKFEMSFAQINQVDPTRVRTAEVPITFAFGREIGGLTLYLKTWSVSSKFAFDTSSRKFTEPRSDVFLNQSGVQVGDKYVTLVEFAATSGPEDVKSFLSVGMSGASISGNSVNSCFKLLTYYSKYLSNRDALALLWATLREFKGGFGSAASQCATTRERDFERLGLPTADLKAELK